MRKTDLTLFTETTNGAASCHQRPWLDRWTKRGLGHWIRSRVRGRKAEVDARKGARAVGRGAERRSTEEICLVVLVASSLSLSLSSVIFGRTRTRAVVHGGAMLTKIRFDSTVSPRFLEQSRRHGGNRPRDGPYEARVQVGGKLRACFILEYLRRRRCYTSSTW